ncbi:FliH/SctL family protein [Nocardioides stalactiti]|uniref:FliH/SctL family protein n=1 Tax=Nocardioides stalactiti TaxID=2755356 RepID=UPI00160305A6|nr:FliH/SctL family protein [Nocardioides stalactiti]
MSSSSERQRAVVLTAEQVGAAGELAQLAAPELRTGQWTRLGDTSLLGDRVTEGVLGDVAERVRAAATAEGYAVGWAQGRRDAAVSAATEERERVAAHERAEERREAEHRAAVEALGRAADEVRAHLHRLADAVEGQATSLAWAITEEIMGREVLVADGADVVRRVLAVLPTTALARVRLHPDQVWAPAVRDLVERGLDVVADDSLGRADALVEWDGSVVDLRVAEAMGRVRTVLTAPAEARS